MRIKKGIGYLLQVYGKRTTDNKGKAKFLTSYFTSVCSASESELWTGKERTEISTGELILR